MRPTYSLPAILTAGALVLATAAPAATVINVSGGGTNVLENAIETLAGDGDIVVITDSATYIEQNEINMNNRTLIASPETATPTIEVQQLTGATAFFNNSAAGAVSQLGDNAGGHITIRRVGTLGPFDLGFWCPTAVGGSVTIENVTFENFRETIAYSLSDGPFTFNLDNVTIRNSRINSITTRGAEGGGPGGTGPGAVWNVTNCVFDGAALNDTSTFNSGHVIAVSPWDRLYFTNCTFSNHRTQAVRSFFNGSAAGSINGTIGMSFTDCTFNGSVGGFPLIVISGGVFEFNDSTLTQTAVPSPIAISSDDVGVIVNYDVLRLNNCEVNAGGVFPRGIQVSSVIKPAVVEIDNSFVLNFSHLAAGSLATSSQGIQCFGGDVSIEYTVIASTVGQNATAINHSVGGGGTIQVDHCDLYLPFTGGGGDPGTWGALDLGPDNGTNWSIRNSIVRATSGLGDTTTVPSTATFVSQYNNIFTDLDGAGPTHGGNFVPGTGDISVSAPVWIGSGPFTLSFFWIDPASPSATGDEFGNPQGSQGLAPPVLGTSNWGLYR